MADADHSAKVSLQEIVFKIEKMLNIVVKVQNMFVEITEMANTAIY